jgi:hypothetical protein
VFLASVLVDFRSSRVLCFIWLLLWDVGLFHFRAQFQMVPMAIGVEAQPNSLLWFVSFLDFS